MIEYNSTLNVYDGSKFVSIPLTSIDNTNVIYMDNKPWTPCAIEKYFEENRNNPHAGPCCMVCNCGKCQRTIC